MSKSIQKNDNPRGPHPLGFVSTSSDLEKNSDTTAYLDLLRFIAISMVVLLHVVSGTLSQSSAEMTGQQTVLYNVILHLCTPGVALFLMVSGTLFLDEHKQVSLKTLFTKYIRRVVLALFLFGTFYSLLELVFTARTVRISFLWQALKNTFTGDTWGHLWYLYLIMGIYLFLPLWKAASDRLSEEQYRYLLILLFLIGSILPWLQSTGFRIGLQIPVNNIYVFYFFVGHYFHRYLREGQKRSWRTAAVVLLLVCIPVTVLDVTYGCGLTDGYNGVTTVAASLAIYYLVSGMKRIPRWSRFWRKASFSVYLLHPLFLNLVYKGLHVTPLLLGGYVLLPVFWAAAMGLSIICAVLLLQVRVFRDYVL